MTTRVLHLTGSPVDEFHADLSRLYAADCLEATADPARYEPVVAHVHPGGLWSFPADLSRATLAAAPRLDLAAAVEHLADLAPDVAVPQMFCLPGMTTYRGLLDLLGVPFVGNPAATMALGAHKARAKAVAGSAGVLTPGAHLLRPGDPLPHGPLPAVVKPVDSDNSVGVALVHDSAALEAAVESAFEVSGEVLVEQYVELGREVRCGVVERGDELVCLPLEEYAVDRDTKPVRDRADKLRRADDGVDNDLALVAKDASYAWIVDAGDPVTEAVHAAARLCHRALGCRDYSLFDFRIDPEGRPWFLEAGLYCSYARTSVVTVMAEAAGITLEELFAAGVDRARDRQLASPVRLHG